MPFFNLPSGSGGGGAAVLTGTGAPSQTLGVNGQLYIDTQNKTIYVKESGSWGNGIALGAGAWSELTGKPSDFPPSIHAHVISDVDGLSAALDGKQAAGSYAAAVHSHTASSITDFAAQAALYGPVTSVNGKTGAVVITDASWGNLTGVPATFPPSAHTHVFADIIGLQSALDGKQAAGSYAAAVHTHTASQITDFAAQAALYGPVVSVNGKTGAVTIAPPSWNDVTSKPSTFPPSSHTHAIVDVVGLQAALDSKATPADITAAVAAVIDAAPASLDTLNELAQALNDDSSFATTMTNALAGKAPLAHQHEISSINGLQSALNSKLDSDSAIDGGFFVGELYYTNTIVITTQPTSQMATGGAATFSVLATVTPSGGSLTYQWQKSDDSGTTWANVAGGNSASLPLANLTNAADSGDRYRVVISATNAETVTSNAATLTVPAKTIVFTLQPQSQTTFDGGTAVFSATAAVSPSGTPTYQWQRLAAGTWENVSGGFSPTLTVTGVTANNNNDQYRVIASAADAASVTSNAATLTVSVQPQIELAYVYDYAGWFDATVNYSNSSDAFPLYPLLSVNDTPGATYQWQLSMDAGATWSSFANAQSRTLQLTAGLLPNYNNNAPPIASTLWYNTPYTWTVPLVRCAITTSMGTTHKRFAILGAGYTDPGVQNPQGLAPIKGNYSSREGKWFSLLDAANFTYAPPTGGRVVVTQNGVSAYQYPSLYLYEAIIEPTPWQEDSALRYSTIEKSTDGGITWMSVNGASLENPASSRPASQQLGIEASVGDLFRARFGELWAVPVRVDHVVSNFTAPSLSNQTASGGNATFTVTVPPHSSGVPFDAVWSKSTNAGQNWSLVNSDGTGTRTVSNGNTILSLPLTELTVADNQALYRCEIRAFGYGNTLGTTNAATLSVPSSDPAHTPVISIDTQPTSQFGTLGGTANFSVVASVVPARSLGYQWQRKARGATSYTDVGTNSATLSRGTLASTNDYDLYRVTVSTRGAVSVTSTEVVLRIPFITITQQPTGNIYYNLGASHTFSVTATTNFDATIAYQWQRANTQSGPWSDISGATNSTHVTQQAGYYRCVLQSTQNTGLEPWATVVSNVASVSWVMA